MTFHVSKKPPNRRIYIKPIHGDCLERIGIKNRGGGYAIIDTNAKVYVGDLVFCSRALGEIGGYIKQVKEINGDSVIVGTAYLDETRDFQFEAAEIMGTVLETFGKISGFREYVRPTHSRKKGTETAPIQLTIDNVEEDDR